jgi:hypothetical protein
VTSSLLSGYGMGVSGGLLLFLSVLLPAHAGGVPMDSAYAGSGLVPLGAFTLHLDGARILMPDGRVLVDRLVAAPVWDGAHLCAADEGYEGAPPARDPALVGVGRLRCWNALLEPVTLALGGRPGRLALAGAHVAWVASPAGWPSVHVGSVDASEPARALTNVGLQRVPGRAPEGFVPPPLGDTLRFDGDALRWDTPSGPQAVRWR